MHYRFRGNPNTNDAGRYSLALRRWRDGGCQGPAPSRPASLDPATEYELTAAEVARQKRAQASLFEASQRKLF